MSSPTPDDLAQAGGQQRLSSETLLDMLRRLPPSKELLDFYHQKVQSFAGEEKKWIQVCRVTAISG